MAYFTTPHCIYVGGNALSEAMTKISECGKKALIVTGRHIGKSPMYVKLTNQLKAIDIEYCTFDGITGEPTDVMIMDGLKVYKKNECDFIIGIGGGSPLDSAKAIAAMSVNPGKISDYMGMEIGGKIPAVVAIPTTAGTGSEATKFTIITDVETDVKMLLKGDALTPRIAVVDSDFTMDMPKSVTASTGLDAFTHAVEAFTSKKASAMTDTLAISAVKRIMINLPIVYANGFNAKAREEMAIAALEAGICINNSSVTIVHGMSRPIGAMFHIAHGLSNAMLLSECMKFALDGAYERFAMLARETNTAEKNDSDEVAAWKFVGQIENLCQICEVPTICEYGIDKDAFYSAIGKMAEDAIASGSPGNTRKNVTADDCIEIYKKVYE